MADTNAYHYYDTDITGTTAAPQTVFDITQGSPGQPMASVEIWVSSGSEDMLVRVTCSERQNDDTWAQIDAGQAPVRFDSPPNAPQGITKIEVAKTTGGGTAKLGMRRVA
jgi:hypothetical protein